MMRMYKSIIVCVTIVMLIVLTAVVYINGEESIKTIKVMTFNIRTDEGTPSGWSWDVRGDGVTKIIENYGPDVLGIQEGLKHQVDYLIANLPDYVMVGEGLQGGTSREHNAIFYKRDSFYLREAGSFWLKPIPDIVTWVRLAFRDDGREFTVFNTHLHQGQRPRNPTGWLMLLQKAQEFERDYEIPIFLIGDMNARKGESLGWRILNEREPPVFRDAWLYAKEREGPVKSSGFKERFVNHYDQGLWYKCIDWILFMGDVTPLSIVTIMDKQRELYPSDHRPVMADFVFKPVDYEPFEIRGPSFKYSDLEVSSLEVKAGEYVIVRFILKNIGGFGTAQVKLYVDGEVIDEKECFLLSNTSEEVSFTITLYKPGEHEVTVDALEPKTLKVESEAPF